MRRLGTSVALCALVVTCGCGAESEVVLFDDASQLGRLSQAAKGGGGARCPRTTRAGRSSRSYSMTCRG